MSTTVAGKWVCRSYFLRVTQNFSPPNNRIRNRLSARWATSKSGAEGKKSRRRGNTFFWAGGRDRPEMGPSSYCTRIGRDAPGRRGQKNSFAVSAFAQHVKEKLCPAQPTLNVHTSSDQHKSGRHPQGVERSQSGEGEADGHSCGIGMRNGANTPFPAPTEQRKARSWRRLFPPWQRKGRVYLFCHTYTSNFALFSQQISCCFACCTCLQHFFQIQSKRTDKLLFRGKTRLLLPRWSHVCRRRRRQYRLRPTSPSLPPPLKKSSCELDCSVNRFPPDPSGGLKKGRLYVCRVTESRERVPLTPNSEDAMKDPASRTLLSVLSWPINGCDNSKGKGGGGRERVHHPNP